MHTLIYLGTPVTLFDISPTRWRSVVERSASYSTVSRFLFGAGHCHSMLSTSGLCLPGFSYDPCGGWSLHVIACHGSTHHYTLKIFEGWLVNQVGQSNWKISHLWSQQQASFMGEFIGVGGDCSIMLQHVVYIEADLWPSVMVHWCILGCGDVSCTNCSK